MKSKDLMIQAKEDFSKAFLSAIDSADQAALANAVAEFSENIQKSLMEEYEEARANSGDNAVLATRGVRVLTSAETK